ncbi:MAG: hypothetical protein AAF560_17970 [Acidobacteriota bacterium]
MTLHPSRRSRWLMIGCLALTSFSHAYGDSSTGHGDSSNAEWSSPTFQTLEGARALGRWQGEGGSVDFSSDATIVGLVRTDIEVNGKRFLADVDYNAGVLQLDGGDQVLNEADMMAVLGAYRALETVEVPEGNSLALLFVYRSLGFLAESPRDFVHSPIITELPRLVQDDDGTFAWVGIDHGGGTEPPQPPDDGDDGCFDSPACIGGGLSDSNPAIIRCVEHGFYYCSEWDYYPNGLISGERDMTSSAPAVPPTWSQAEAGGIPTWGAPVDGGITCSGRCGPGCAAPGSSVGGGGAWGLGCLIHDHCAWVAGGGSPSGWDKGPFSFDCGAELRAAADDHYTPPGLCPGATTVGGAFVSWLPWPAIRVVSAGRTPDSGALGLLRRECSAFVCAGITPGVDPFTCEQAYSSILDTCEDCNKDFFFDAIRAGTVTPVASFHTCAQLQCPNLLPGDLNGYQQCVRRDWRLEDRSAIRACMLGDTTVCSASDCSDNFCAAEFDAFQQAGPDTEEESLWRYCLSMCQSSGFCGDDAPQCSYRSCMETVCADEGMPPGLECLTSEEGGVGNILVSYLHRQCIVNAGC